MGHSAFSAPDPATESLPRELGEAQYHGQQQVEQHNHDADNPYAFTMSQDGGAATPDTKMDDNGPRAPPDARIGGCGAHKGMEGDSLGPLGKGDWRGTPAAEKTTKKKRKSVMPRELPQHQREIHQPRGRREARKQLDAFMDDFMTAAYETRHPRGAPQRVEGWAQELNEVEERVAPFAQHAGIRRRIAEARECVISARAAVAWERHQQGHADIGEGRAAHAADWTDTDEEAEADWLLGVLDCVAGIDDVRGSRARPSSGQEDADSVETADVVVRVKVCKNKGNSDFASGDYAAACHAYQDALCIIDEHCRRHERGSGQPAGDLVKETLHLHNNRALALLRLAAGMVADGEDAAASDTYFAAMEAASAALVLDAGNKKAEHRRRSALDGAYGIVSRRTRESTTEVSSDTAGRWQ
jgi:hypothetical protein